MNYGKSNKEKIKRIFKHSVHIIGYISTFIVLFLSIIMGVQSCNNQDNRQEKPIQRLNEVGSRTFVVDNLYTNNKQLTIRLNSVISLVFFNVNYNNNAEADLNVTLTTLNGSSYNFTRFYNYSNGGVFFNGSNHSAYPNASFDSYNQSSINYRTSATTPSNYSDRLINKVEFLNLTDEQYNQMSYYLTNDLDYTSIYSNGYDEGYQTGYDEGYQTGLSEGGSAINTFTDEVIINYDFDFRYLLGSSIDSSTGLFYSDNDLSSYSNHLDLIGLTFKCNDITYNTIRLTFVSMGNSPVVYFDNNTSSTSSYATYSKNTSELFGDDYTKYYSLINVLYLNIDSNNNITDSVIVYEGYEVTTTLIQVGDGTINTAFDYRKPHWTNQSFRRLTIVNDNNTKVNVPTFGETFTTFELFSEGGVITASNVNTLDVFSLLTSAFNSITSFLSIAILPNITIGILLFIPLIVTIVLFIIKLLRK